VLAWIGFALLVAAGGLAIRWMSARTDALGRPRPFPYIAVVVLVALGCASLAPFVLRVRLERRLASATSELLGTSVEVRCQSFGGAFVDVGADLGYVVFRPDGTPAQWTLIKRDQCADLSDYLSSDKQEPTRDQIVAVHVLTHEAIHMSGVQNEAQAECMAMQRDAVMAEHLGASPEAAGELAIAYWRDVYPWMPAAYRSEECAPGEALDAGRSDAPWVLAQRSR
jgi:hypothetical protein